MDAAGAGHARLRVVGVRSGVAPPLAERFAARPETAPDLARALVPGSMVALINGEPDGGAASCGKTQLAVHAAEALWRSGQVELLAWVDASSHASLLTGYLHAAARAGIEPAGTAEQVAARFTGWLTATPRPWLVVLDNLRDVADLDGLLPHGPAGAVLITTRNADIVASIQRRGRVVPVGPLSTRESLSYLRGCLSDDPDQRHGAIDLAMTLDGDPCALTHAGAVIAGSTLTCRDYQHHYNTRLAQLAVHQANGTPVAPVAVTWLLSAERAEQLAPGATSLQLAVAALVDGRPVPAPVFTCAAACRSLSRVSGAAFDAMKAWEAVRALAHVGLLIIDQSAVASSHGTRPPFVWLPQTAATAIRKVMPPRVFEPAARMAADALLEIWPVPEPLPWQAAALRACAAALQHTAGGWLWTGDACHPLLMRTGQSLEAAQLTHPAVSHWTQITTTSNALLGATHRATLTAGKQLAHALLMAGEPGQAVVRWQQLVAGHARLTGPDHPDTLAARVNLGRALVAAGELADAVAVLEQVVTGYQRVRGLELDGLHAREELAAACQAAGRSAEAMTHYRGVFGERERAQGSEHPATLAAREKLAGACLAAGRGKEAISGYKKVLSDRQRAFGADRPDTIATLRNLAAAYEACGKIAAALQQHEQACAGYERALGANHHDTLACRADLATAYQAAGRFTDAVALLRGTLARCERALPAGDPLTEVLRQALSALADTTN